MAAGVQSFLSEIAIVPYNFAPLGWAFCNGQLLAISSNTALFSLLGTDFGGNGTSNFALPNFQGCVPLGVSSDFPVGATGGTTTVTLGLNNMPAHTHLTNVPLGLPAGGAGSDSTPVNEYLAASGTDNLYAATAGAVTIPCIASAVTAANAGGGQPYNNMKPYLAMSFIIAMSGIFPPR
jgi:microcystin-dependent protein